MGQMRLYEQIIDSLTSGVLAIDSTGAVIAQNRAALQHLGVSDKDLELGSHIDQLPLPESFLNVMRDIMAAPRPMSRQELVVPQQDGYKKEIGFSVSLLDGDLPFNGAVFLFIDMTERRKLERAAELNRQLAQIGGLTAGVVHELRNPLSVISGMGEVLQRKLEEGDSGRRCADVIVSEARRMAISISQFLGFAKPFDLDPEFCDATAIAERAIELCKPAAEKKGVIIERRIQKTPINVTADPARLAQALSNLVVNAVDAVQQGGWVCCSAQQDAAEIVFEVLDNGPGIDPSAGEDIFNPFFSRKQGGTGLGLAICHRIVTAHAGVVYYTNRPEGGAAFTIRIPFERPAI